jgi:hypothetical protein
MAPRADAVRQRLAKQEPVVDEEGLFDRQARIAALQLADAIVFNAVREDQILGASGRANRVGLDKAQARNGPQQAGGLEKAVRNHVAAKLLETRDFDRAHAWRPVGARITPNLYIAQYSSFADLNSTKSNFEHELLLHRGSISICYRDPFM